MTNKNLARKIRFKKLVHKYYSFLLIVITALFTSHNLYAQVVATNVSELHKFLKTVKPGDTIFLQKGEWKNASMVISASGTAQSPIVVTPQKSGETVFTGNSDLKIGGSYLIISGLHFNNGYTLKKNVIEFKVNDSLLANYCRLTQTVIENYSQPERFSADVWVTLWGKNNRVDHCTFIDKLNVGPTLIVELNDERSQKNYHSIDSNYFNGRQRLGSNGGETIRVGVSRYSLTASYTQIHDNYFERCNGETEIVSIKSGNNTINHNTFFECEGGLVLRHGAENIITNNVFLGNNKPFTGGVRVINSGHTIANNYFKDLAGTGFRSALSVLNGVPNSLINRYYQVTNVLIEHNSFINCASILFGAGKDNERTLSPQKTTFTRNLIVNSGGSIYEDANSDGGIQISSNAVIQTKKPVTVTAGFISLPINQVKKDSFPVAAHPTYGADFSRIHYLQKNAVGADWYYADTFQQSVAQTVFSISRQEINNIGSVINQIKDGDIIQFTDTGLYKLERPIFISKNIIIRGADGKGSKTTFVNASLKTFPAFIIIENKGSLYVSNISFNGAYESYGAVEAGIKSTDEPMNVHYKIKIDSCVFYNFNEGSYCGFKASKNTFADSVIISNSFFRNISSTAINIAEEKDDKGIYDAENIVINNSIFTNILGSAVNIYRGGNDESTTGPSVLINHCTFNEVDNREQGATIRLVGAQQAQITNSIFSSCGKGGRSIEFREFRWDVISVDYCDFYKSGKVESFYNKVLGKNIYYDNPQFVNANTYNFQLKSNSPLLKKSSTGGALGAIK